MENNLKIRKTLLVIKEYLLKTFSISFTNWVMLISAIGSLMVGIGTFYTIHYINKQNKLSIKPEFLINDELLKLRIEWDSTNKISVFSQNLGDSDNFYDTIGESRNDDKYFHLNLINVGLGIAKNISFSWSFDTINCIKIINSYLKYFKFYESPKCYLEAIDIKNNYISLSGVRLNNNVFTNIKESTVVTFYHEEFKFLLPYSTSSEIQELRLPYVFLKSYSIYKFMKERFNPKQDTWGIEHKFPELILTLKYSDMVNEFISQQYRVSFEVLQNIIQKRKSTSLINVRCTQ
jgi:hypothetical protein